MLEPLGFGVVIGPPIGEDVPVFGVGDVVRKLRKDRDWTLDRLAEVSGVSRTTLWELENGKLDARGSTLRRVAEAFGLDRLPEPSELAPSLPKVPPKPPTPIRTGVTYFDQPSSTNRENNIPRGDADDATDARIRELEARIEQNERKHAAEIQNLRNLLKSVTRVAIKRAESGKAVSDKTRRGKTDK